MSLRSIIDQITEKRAEASIVVEELDPRVQSGAGGLIRQAKIALEALELQYREEVLKHVVIIAVSGNGSAEFANISKYALKTVTVDYKLVNTRLLETLRRRHSQPEYGSHENLIVLAEMPSIRSEFGILQLAPPRINNAVDNIYGQPLDLAIDKLIAINYNSSLYSAISRREISRKALEAEFVGKAMPVVLYNYTGSVDTTFLPEPVQVIEVDGAVDEDFVKEIFNGVKNKLKKNNKTTNNETVTENQGE